MPKSEDNYGVLFEEAKKGRSFSDLVRKLIVTVKADEKAAPVKVGADKTDEKKHPEKRLRESRKMLKNLSRHFDELLEEERTRIAFNLHDDLGQKLAAINMNIAWVKGRMGVQSQGVSRKMEEMSLMINESIESIKDITSCLRPVILFDLGVVPAFDSLLKKIEKESGIICSFVYDKEDLTVDNRTSLTLYRILQEYLTNIIRHSDASEAIIKLHLCRNKIELQIDDNGKVPDENEIISLRKLVFAGMRERVSALNGRIRIKGDKESRTGIKVSIPLKSRNKDD